MYASPLVHVRLGQRSTASHHRATQQRLRCGTHKADKPDTRMQVLYDESSVLAYGPTHADVLRSEAFALWLERLEAVVAKAVDCRSIITEVRVLSFQTRVTATQASLCIGVAPAQSLVQKVCAVAF